MREWVSERKGESFFIVFRSFGFSKWIWKVNIAKNCNILDICWFYDFFDRMAVLLPSPMCLRQWNLFVKPMSAWLRPKRLHVCPVLVALNMNSSEWKSSMRTFVGFFGAEALTLEPCVACILILAFMSLMYLDYVYLCLLDGIESKTGIYLQKSQKNW